MKCPKCHEVLPFKQFTIAKMTARVIPFTDKAEDHILLQAVCLKCMESCHKIICSMTPDK